MLDLWRDALAVLSLVAAPVIGVTLVLGLVVSVVQAATQLSDSALAFVPKVAALIVVLALAGGWMVTQLEQHLRRSLTRIGELGASGAGEGAP